MFPHKFKKKRIFLKGNLIVDPQNFACRYPIALCFVCVQLTHPLPACALPGKEFADSIGVGFFETSAKVGRPSRSLCGVATG